MTETTNAFGFDDQYISGQMNVEVEEPRSNANFRYLSKMKDVFKKTLQGLIKEKEAEKQKQDDIIKNYNEFFSRVMEPVGNNKNQ